MIVSIALVAIAGFVLSLYGYFIDGKIKQDPTYKPACDLSDRISCSKPILSPYGKLLYVSNTLVGMAFYGLVFLLALLGFPHLIFVCACAALAASGVLAYILYFKVGAFCLLCHAIYAVNILLFVLSYSSI